MFSKYKEGNICCRTTMKATNGEESAFGAQSIADHNKEATTSSAAISDSRAGKTKPRKKFYSAAGSCLQVTSLLTLCLLVCVETVLLSTASNCSAAYYVHWNTSNPLFRLREKNGYVISVNRGNTQFEYDQVNIICPVYVPGTDEESTEKYIIYNVSREEYETCRISEANPRVVAVCDKPHKLMYYTITFRPFTPQPGGLEFPPGHEYYFISTSSKDDLHRRVGGRCASHNMKVVFEVCCKPHEVTATPYFNRSTTKLVPAGTIAVPYSTSPSAKKPAAPTPTKKTKEYRNHPNEVLKNEELTSNVAFKFSPHVLSIVLCVILSPFLVSFNL